MLRFLETLIAVVMQPFFPRKWDWWTIRLPRWLGYYDLFICWNETNEKLAARFICWRIDDDVEERIETQAIAHIEAHENYSGPDIWWNEWGMMYNSDDHARYLDQNTDWGDEYNECPY